MHKSHQKNDDQEMKRLAILVDCALGNGPPSRPSNKGQRKLTAATCEQRGTGIQQISRAEYDDHDQELDPLCRLARIACSRKRPRQRHPQSYNDCLQTAYLAGLMAVRSAQRSGDRASEAVLLLAMRQAVTRLLNRPIEIREADIPEPGLFAAL